MRGGFWGAGGFSGFFQKPGVHEKTPGSRKKPAVQVKKTPGSVEKPGKKNPRFLSFSGFLRSNWPPNMFRNSFGRSGIFDI